MVRRERRDERVSAVKRIFDAAVNEVDEYFDEGLHFTRDDRSVAGLRATSSGTACTKQAKSPRENHGIDIDRPEISGAVIPDPAVLSYGKPGDSAGGVECIALAVC